ncbi:MAG: helix-turn-helix domain-containing protein [Deltaproteobacteria bacterium]|nr:helix-turn-helix domain-containing protein [Deltaproteobacteria bacterium]
MSNKKTGFDRYFEGRLKDRAFAGEYRRAKAEIRAVDDLVGALERARASSSLSKADLARESGVPAESVRRLFTAKRKNPTLLTFVRLAAAVGLSLRLDSKPGPSERRRATA